MEGKSERNSEYFLFYTRLEIKLPLFLFDSHGGDEAEVVVADAGARLFDGVVGRAGLEAIGMACLGTKVADVVALAVRDGYRVATRLGEQVFEGIGMGKVGGAQLAGFIFGGDAPGGEGAFLVVGSQAGGHAWGLGVKGGGEAVIIGDGE